MEEETNKMCTGILGLVLPPQVFLWSHSYIATVVIFIIPFSFYNTKREETFITCIQVFVLFYISCQWSVSSCTQPYVAEELRPFLFLFFLPLHKEKECKYMRVHRNKINLLSSPASFLFAYPQFYVAVDSWHSSFLSCLHITKKSESIYQGTWN